MIVLWFLIYFIIILFCYFLTSCFFRIYNVEKIVHNIPGPKPLPIIGNALFLMNIQSLKDMFYTARNLMDVYSQKKGIVKLWMGPKLIIFVSDHKHIEIVLNSADALEKDPLYNIIGLTGNGLFVKNGDQWKDLRKPLNRVLNRKSIEYHIEEFHKTALKFCEVIEKYCDNNIEFDVKSFATNFTLDTLAVSNFGYEINELHNNRYNISEMLKTSLEITLQMMAKPHYNICLPLAKITNMGRKLHKFNKIYWELVHELLQGSLLKKQRTEETEREYYSDVLIQKAEDYKLNHVERCRLATDFFIAGFDSSAVIISYTLLLLAMHPEHQDAVYQEQIDIVGEDARTTPNWLQLSKMTCLGRILKEVMRLYCPIAILRRLSNDIDLGEYVLPKGSTASLMFYSLHRDPRYWSHPLEFYPDHFLPENIACRPKGVYLPFSWGPRSCPGSQLAITTIKMLISVAIRKYVFETQMEFKNLEYKYSLFLESNQGYMVRIRSRHL